MIEVLSGTNRPGSNTLRLAKIVHGYYAELGIEAQLLDLQDLPAEIFHPDSYSQKPASFLPLSQRILAADGVHIVTPEYNGSFPGVLKYFIDMLKFPESFENRCVAFTGLAAGVWGALRSVEQLQMIFGYRNALVLPQRVWIPGINQRWDAATGGLNDEVLAQRLRDQAQTFGAFVARNKGLAAKA